MRALWTGLLLLAGVVHGAEPVQRIQQMVDYLGVDYREAVSAGEVVNAAEYEEMQDFARTLEELSRELPDTESKAAIQAELRRLRTLVDERADPEEVAAVASGLRRLLISGYGLSVVPSKLPDLLRGARLYADNCASCHGVDGRGNGPLAATLEPPPTDFTDPERYRKRTLYGLYSTITHGVEGTAMEGWTGLPEQDRWSLAFYVGGLAALPIVSAHSAPMDASSFTREMLTTRTPGELEAEMGTRGAQLAAWLRLHPEALWGETGGSALQYAARKLEESRRAYHRGEAGAAHDLAVTAYLEGFELVEGNLDAVDSRLRRQIESEMTRYRGMLKDGAPRQEVDAQVERLQALLDEAGTKLGSTLLAPATAFTSALVILLREGLEAILVIAALAAFLVKTGRRDGLRYLYFGTGAAFGLGLLTWFVSAYLVEIGGAGRELTEGFAALFAALMLFYVGFWLHSKTGAAQWKAFIQGSVQKALSRGTLWGLSLLAFVAVYREIFETVLFYQALWLQTGGEGRGMIFTGFAVAAGVLVLLGWGILRYSTRLPLRQFFAATGIFMFVLAVVFAGKGIAALQEAGKLSFSRVDFPSVELLGIYPNLEGLLTQSALVLLAALLLWRAGRRERAVAGAPGVTDRGRRA